MPLIEALEQMLGYAKFMKDKVTKKRLVYFEDDDRMQHCSDITTRSLVQKKRRSGCLHYFMYNWVITLCESNM